MSQTSVEQATQSPEVLYKRRWRRFFVGAATVSIVIATFLTAYVAIPRLALERGLAYDSYTDATALSFVGPEEIGKPVIGADGSYSQDGWDVFYQGFLDRERRYALVEAQRRQNGRNAPSIWAVIDSEEEEVIGSLRVPHPFSRQMGMDSWTTAWFEGWARSSAAGDTNALELGCRVELPKWWPGRLTVGNSQGAIWRPIYLRFNTHSRRWEPYSSRNILEWGDERMWDRLAREKTVLLDGTADELVVQHRTLAPLLDSQSKDKRIHFQRLARRNKSTGEILWEVLPSLFPPSQQPTDSFEVMLPGFALDSECTWCLIEQNLSGNRLPMVIKYWKVDLQNGNLIEVSPPYASASWTCEIISDGQSVLLRDSTTQSLVVWRPDHDSRVIGVRELSDSDNIGMLSRRRILCVEHADNGEVVIRVVGLDGDELRQIFP